MNHEHEPVLPADRHQLLRGHLMSEISRKPRSTTRRYGWAAVPVLAGALALTVVLNTGGAAPTASAASVVLDRAAAAAAAKPRQEVKDSQYVYVQRQDPEVKAELWLPVDGKRPALLDDSRYGRRELTPLDEPASVNNPNYRYVATLPTDPAALLALIKAQTEGQGQSPEHAAFKAINRLVAEQIATPEVSAALFRAAGLIPGAVVHEDVTDGLGRHGVGVALPDGKATVEWVFDRDSYEYLGARWGQGADAVVRRAVVDKAGDRP
ncbi:hypothetical protein GCM10020229_15320 [Kitasatospora albolonga]|uniref:CU044_5270 family protein n=1 Tax=Kitasatospora albolonga TaxID=68173 RepID=UPI0031EF49AD